MAMVRESRLALGLSQEQFARQLGVSFATVNRWETGRTRPRASAMARLTTIRSLVPTSQAQSDTGSTLANMVPASTTFVGRSDELHQLASQLTLNRLVTVVGPAGSGKTRLCRQAATSGAIGGFSAISFVTLEAAATTDDLVAAIGRQLGAPVAGGMASLIEQFAGVSQLLILDNCEHVLSACRELVTSLIGSSGQLRILATSREALGLPDEGVIRLSPLDASGAGSPAVALFVDRARRERADYAPSGQELEDVARLCRRLDGLPLGVELAAGCINQLTPSAMLDLLAQKLDLPKPEQPTGPARQRELAAAVAWSHDLLSARERTVLEALSVFVESFSLDAAEAIAPPAIDLRSGRAPTASDVLLTLASLVAKSMIEASQRDGAIRYSMLQTIRAYSRQRLTASGREAAAMTALWSSSFELAQQVERGMAGRDQGRWIYRASMDAGNLAAAVAWAIERADARRAIDLAGALWRYWYSRSDVDRGLHLLAAALGLTGAGDPKVVPSAARAKALLGAGVIARQSADYPAAVDYLRQFLALAEASGQGGSTAEALNSLAGAYHAMGDSTRAEQYLRRSLDYWEASGDRRGLASALSNLGVLASDRGDQVMAAEYGEQALALRLALGHAESIAISYENLATAALRGGRLDDARRLFAEALHRYAALDEPDGIVTALEGLAPLVDPMVGAQLLWVADRTRREIGVPRSTAAEEYQQVVLERLAGALSPESLAQARSGAEMLSLAQAVALADSEMGEDPPVAPQQMLRRRLTRREREVLELVAGGQTSKEIASSLGLSTRTVDRHLANIYGKIGARGRAEAIAFALRTGGP